MKIPQKTKEMLQNNIQTIIDNNSYNMRVHSKDLQSIIDNGFKILFQESIRILKKNLLAEYFSIDLKQIKPKKLTSKPCVIFKRSTPKF